MRQCQAQDLLRQVSDTSQSFVRLSRQCKVALLSSRAFDTESVWQDLLSLELSEQIPPSEHRLFAM